MDRPPGAVGPKRNIKFDKEATQKPPPIKGIPDKYKNHRKSSIPFADRQPQVRFVRATEEHSHLEIGSFTPSKNPLNPTDVRPILKKTSHPILVRNREVGDAAVDKTNINWQIEDSALYVERVIQHFSSVERETRGGLDILTYPVCTSSGVEALARLHCGFTVTIICIEDLLILTAQHGRESDFGRYIQKIQDSAKGLLIHLGRLREEANSILKRAKQRHSQWGQEVMGKGQFKIEPRRSSIIPVYNSKRMPENVTLYENEIELDACAEVAKAGASLVFSPRPEGKTQFFRTEGELAVMVETKDDVITRTQEGLDEAEVFCLIECLLNHAHELVYYATARLSKARKMLDDAVFDEDYATLKDRIVRFEKDASLDPLCALELKSTLGEVLSRKEELVNTSGHVLKCGDRMIRFLKLFIKYCKTVGIPKKAKLCWCGSRVNCYQLFAEMSNVQGMDFMISMPLVDSFLRDFCHVELKASGESMTAENGSENKQEQSIANL